MNKKTLELLSPARDADIAIQAILHGADAVYIGPPSHGARKGASNSIDDIAKVVDFAHQFRAKVYSTVNTILYDDEISRVEELCGDLYRIGVDALIVQDIGLLRMKLPPIALHASTQCDIRSPEKAKFLQEVGFSQIVLARELTLEEIKEITSSVDIPVECFIHGALCVSYSGKCHASLATTGRSANRGECAQICRYPFSLIDSSGKIYAKEKYLLSLKDLNSEHNLKDLIEAGVSSFKIEGRLKDMEYVKNITALYNIRLNKIIEESNGEFCRSSFGEVNLKFNPQANKSFNRDFTDYFRKNINPVNIASIRTPKSIGEPINDLKELNNGDGISYFDKTDCFTGVNVNRIEGSKIINNKKIEVSGNVQLYRTSDVNWSKLMSSQTATRKLQVDIHLSSDFLSAKDETGTSVKIALEMQPQLASKLMDYRSVFEKLGNTSFVLGNYFSSLGDYDFFPISYMTQKRRELIEKLKEEKKASYPFDFRRPENIEAVYPEEQLIFSENVANHLAETFYRNHGVTTIEKAAEIDNSFRKSDRVVMTTRHCILRELGLCRKKSVSKSPSNIKLPLYLNYKGGRFRLNFDCNKCEMNVIAEKK